MVYVLEYLEFTQLSNSPPKHSHHTSSFRVPGIYTALKLTALALAYFVCFRVPGIYTALKLPDLLDDTQQRFRVPGIYTALKLQEVGHGRRKSFRVPGIYTALKPTVKSPAGGFVLEYLEFTQLSNLKFEKSGQ